MNALAKVLAGATLLSSLLFATVAQAMPISEFDRLPAGQGGHYTVYLIRSAMRYLQGQGHPDQADAVWKLFETSTDKATPTTDELLMNLNAIRKFNLQHAGDANFKPYEVEHAVALTLKEHGYIVPVSQLLLASKDYKPDSDNAKIGEMERSHAAVRDLRK